MNRIVLCNYCLNPAKLVTGADIYPHRPDLYSKQFWECEPCDARVGCHAPNKGYGDGSRPLGRLANAELRAAKSAAHAAFDPIWKSGCVSRAVAYKRLAVALAIDKSKCHIGEFDVQTCKRVVELCKTF